jgi:hypothetical protein
MPCPDCGGDVWLSQRICGECRATILSEESVTPQSQNSGVVDKEGGVVVMDTPTSRPRVLYDDGEEEEEDVSPASALNFVDSGDRIFVEKNRAALNLKPPKEGTGESGFSGGGGGGGGGDESDEGDEDGGGNPGRKSQPHDGDDDDDGDGEGGSGGEDDDASLLDTEKLRLLYMCKQYTEDNEAGGKKVGLHSLPGVRLVTVTWTLPAVINWICFDAQQ